jgi:hypothetical protein
MVASITWIQSFQELRCLKFNVIIFVSQSSSFLFTCTGEGGTNVNIIPSLTTLFQHDYYFPEDWPAFGILKVCLNRTKIFIKYYFSVFWEWFPYVPHVSLVQLLCQSDTEFGNLSHLLRGDNEWPGW